MGVFLLTLWWHVLIICWRRGLIGVLRQVWQQQVADAMQDCPAGIDVEVGDIRWSAHLWSDGDIGHRHRDVCKGVPQLVTAAGSKTRHARQMQQQ